MQIIKQLVQISLRKREPQDLDYSLQAAILLTMSVVFLRYMALSSLNSFSNPFAYGLLSVVGESLVIYALLRSQDKASRFVQTITALFGITMIMAMILAMVFGIAGIATLAPMLMMVASILVLALPVLMIWIFYLMVLILRAALDCSTIASLMLTIGYNAIGTLLVSLFFPEFQAETQAMLESLEAAMEAAQLEAQSK